MKRICLGKIINAHGVKGLVKILPFGDDPQLLGGEIHTSESGTETLSITLKNKNGKYILAEIEGITDRTAAESLKGTELFVDKSALPTIEDENTFYHSDLVGLTALDKSGEKVGTVIAVENFGAGDLLEIQPISGESFYLPFRDEFTGEIDLAQKQITVMNVDVMRMD